MPLQCLTQAPPSLKGQTKMCRPTGAPAMPQATDAVDDSLQPVQVPNPRESDRVPRHAPVGDPLDITKDPSRTRFLFQNPNGISVGAGGDLESVLKHAQDMKCDHLVLPETKLDTYNRRVKSRASVQIGSGAVPACQHWGQNFSDGPSSPACPRATASR